jgi:hypothetical protein
MKETSAGNGCCQVVLTSNVLLCVLLCNQGKNKPVEVPVASARAPAGVTMKAL